MLHSFKLPLLAASTAGLMAFTGPAAAHGPSADLSLISTLPLVMSVAAPVSVLSAGAVFTVVSVQAVAAGTVWVLARASDGVRISITLAGTVVSGMGAMVSVVALGTGWVLSEAGRAICFIPNEIGASLLHNEAITR